ncbi:MAG: hypothetical protein AB9915_01540 [Candidatus Dojkabacteria bacterium]
MKKEKEKKPLEEKEVQQLGLGIKEPFKNKFYNIKRKVDYVILKFEVKKFLKDPLVWATLVISLVMIASQILLIQKNFSSLPTYLPIFQTFVVVTSKLVPKELIYIYPCISAVIFLFGTTVISNYYNREKSLTKILLFTILFTCISQSIILIDLVRIF